MATPSEIAESSKCYCLNNVQTLSAIVYLLAQIEGSGMTIAQILDNSKCYCLNEEQANKAIVYLLNRIMVNGSIGGGGAVLYGSGSPEGVETADVGALYIDTDTYSFYFKQTGSGNTGWVAVILNLP